MENCGWAREQSAADLIKLDSQLLHKCSGLPLCLLAITLLRRLICSSPCRCFRTRRWRPDPKASAELDCYRFTLQRHRLAPSRFAPLFGKWPWNWVGVFAELPAPGLRVIACSSQVACGLKGAAGCFPFPLPAVARWSESFSPGAERVGIDARVSTE